LAEHLPTRCKVHVWGHSVDGSSDAAFRCQYCATFIYLRFESTREQCASRQKRAKGSRELYSLRPERVDSGVRVLGRGAASPLPTSKGSRERCKLPGGGAVPRPLNGFMHFQVSRQLILLRYWAFLLFYFLFINL